MQGARVTSRPLAGWTGTRQLGQTVFELPARTEDFSPSKVDVIEVGDVHVQVNLLELMLRGPWNSVFCFLWVGFVESANF